MEVILETKKNIKGLWLPQFIWNGNQSIRPQNTCFTAWNCTTQTQEGCYVLTTQNMAKPTRFIKHDHFKIIIYITGVWWARLPCYPALSLGFSRGVSPVRMNQFTEILHLSAISRSLFTTNYHVTVLLARRVWCHRCSFLSTQTSPQSKGWPGPQSIIHRFHVYHPYRHSLPHDHDPCSPGTTTRGATTARWPPGRWGVCWPSFQLKSETEKKKLGNFWK